IVVQVGYVGAPADAGHLFSETPGARLVEFMRPVVAKGREQGQAVGGSRGQDSREVPFQEHMLAVDGSPPCASERPDPARSTFDRHPLRRLLPASSSKVHSGDRIGGGIWSRCSCASRRDPERTWLAFRVVALPSESRSSYWRSRAWRPDGRMPPVLDRRRCCSTTSVTRASTRCLRSGGTAG